MQKAAARREQGLRLKEMTAKRRQDKLAADENRLSKWEPLLAKGVDAQQRKIAIANEGFDSEADLQRAVDDIKSQISIAKQRASGAKPAAPPLNEAARLNQLRKDDPDKWKQQ